MKRHLLLAVLLNLAFLSSEAQSSTFDYQLYHDVNGNCIYDTGEPLLYNTPLWPTLNYVNTSNAVVAATHSAYCGSSPMTVNNYSTPATNTFVLGSDPSFPGFVPSSTCNVWKNNPYGTTVYLPIGSADPVSATDFNTNLFSGWPHTVPSMPICYTYTTDTVSFDFQVQNIFACSTGVSPRTYSLFLDGVFFEQFNTTGLPWQWNNVSGINGYGSLSEGYGTSNAYLAFSTGFPLAMAVPGLHTLTVKSTPVYNSPLSAINKSYVLNSVLCTNITGHFYSDCNNNCIKDLTESGMPGSLVNANVSNGSYTGNFGADQNGNFSLKLPASGTYTMTIAGTGQSIIPCTPTTYVFSGTSPVSPFLIGVKSTTQHDPSVSLYWGSSGVANPGSSLPFYVNVSNTFLNFCSGSGTNSGKLKVVLKPFLTYSGSNTSPSPTVISASTGDTLVWTVPNFASFPQKTFTVTISSTISVSTPFCVDAYIYPPFDINNNNNHSAMCKTIGAPYDPNSKDAWSKKMLPNGDFPSGETLFYTIHFQNIGTAPAVNVVTIDTLDAKLDIASLKVLQSSFPVQLQSTHLSRQLIFRFNNINLPDATSNEPGSHGYVRYSVKLKTGVAYNSVIKNRAYNYFDYTDPVATNQTSNKLINTTWLDELLPEHDLSLVPNPSAGMLRISAGYAIKKVNVYNQLGQLCLDQESNGNAVNVDMSGQAQGIYIITVTFSDGEKQSRRVIRQ